MHSRRQFLRRSVVGSAGVAVAGLAGCLDGESTAEDDGADDGGGDGDAGRDYTSWLYDPGQFFRPDLTVFTTVDVGRAAERFEAGSGDELGTFEAELDDVAGVDELERLTGLAFATADADERFGAGVAITGTFDVDALADELDRQEAFDVAFIGPVEYEGYEVYMVDDAGEMGGMAIREDAVLFGFFEGIDGNSTEPITALIDEYESPASSYYEAREDGAALIDRLEGDLSVTGVELDAEALGVVDGADPAVEEALDGLVAVGSASDVDDAGDVLVDAVLVYEDDSADGEAIEALVRSEPALEDELEGLDLSAEGRTVALSFSFDPDEVASGYDEPSMPLVAGAFPALAIVGAFEGAFVPDLGSRETEADEAVPARLAVDIAEDAAAESVTVTVTGVAHADDVRIESGTAEIHDLEAEAGSSYTLSAEDDEYVPGDTITVIGVTEDGDETVVATHETSA